ncbi:MAG: Glycerophosphoryl diester phosphodiesterase [Parcubacteria group bacterium GW2011_GWA2_49_16]|nr:MAG: Glycerophosphoryl diester phosphodiesterase [Parcubacteria group bacterium GW2011_GWA2_49_16]
MKIFSHRGLAAGEDENTLLAFKKSVELRLDGVEFDIRYGVDGETVICAHDKVVGNTAPMLAEAFQYLASTNLELLIEFKEYSDDFYAKVVEQIRQYNLVSRTTIFGFYSEAKQFPWATRQDIKLGIIAEYPQHLKKYIVLYNPDMVLLGWGNKKQRLQFKTVWAVLSLAKTFAKYPTVKFVIGVAYTKDDGHWLSKQAGLYGITADMPLP